MEYVALTHLIVDGTPYTPGEIIQQDIPKGVLDWWLRAEAVRPLTPDDVEEVEVETEVVEVETEVVEAEEEEVEEPAPEVDAAEGIVTRKRGRKAGK